MGMFDSFYDASGNAWQTKALGRSLERFEIGDAVDYGPPAYQVKVFGGPDEGPWVDSLATIRDGSLARVPDVRDERLPLLDYHGGWLSWAEADRG